MKYQQSIENHFLNTKLEQLCYVLTRVPRTHIDKMAAHYKDVLIQSMRAHAITIYGKRTGRQ